VAVLKPLLGPVDWRGVTFGTYLSRGQEAAIRALGAVPLVAFSSLRSHFLQVGQLKGFEFNLLAYDIDSYWNQARYITANVNLWPQADVLVMNPDRMAQLTPQQQSWLKQAARDAADRSVGLIATDETRLIPTICRLGTRFAYASSSDLAWLRKSFAPVYARLEQDRQTRSFISRIESLKRTTPPGPALAIPKGCLAASR
jgi:TRAP-type C4-dicarboxylate transport system substrate-binding protein